MTNKDAIEILKPLTEYGVNENGIGTFPMVSTSLQAEALNLAIKVLQERAQGDLISRSALKKEVALMWGDNNHVTDSMCEIIDNAPTVEPCTRTQGEWVENAFDEHHCKRCGHPALWEEEPDGYYEVQSRFCPNCGADMRGKEE